MLGLIEEPRLAIKDVERKLAEVLDRATGRISRLIENYGTFSIDVRYGDDENSEEKLHLRIDENGVYIDYHYWTDADEICWQELRIRARYRYGEGVAKIEEFERHCVPDDMLMTVVERLGELMEKLLEAIYDVAGLPLLS